MLLNLNKALFLSSLLTVALSCEAAPGELNTTATPPPCDGVGGTAECLIAYQQLELEVMAGPGMLGASLNTITFSVLNPDDPAGCGRPVVADNPYCTPEKNKNQTRCDQFYRVPC